MAQHVHLCMFYIEIYRSVNNAIHATQSDGNRTKMRNYVITLLCCIRHYQDMLKAFGIQSFPNGSYTSIHHVTRTDYISTSTGLLQK